jgi:excisionase family DNA binding protein
MSHSTAKPEPGATSRNPHPTLSVADAADYTGLSAAHLRRCVSDGRIRSVRYGRLVRIPVEALDDYLRNGE